MVKLILLGRNFGNILLLGVSVPSCIDAIVFEDILLVTSFMHTVKGILEVRFFTHFVGVSNVGILGVETSFFKIPNSSSLSILLALIFEAIIVIKDNKSLNTFYS